eukprot:CAMPEP_0194351358 /NCGR_PEP_ID=MMETSP0171-20130528/108135_1 /TAXON_ID=218684 /ORGANISM="Corethron pennatum, Strain L29A3" /LENGTH=87 /DNA_ID=CAMNT_0039118981 /DNA_START=555 /DNA_END=815 /DNA_ORIENTATION=-
MAAESSSLRRIEHDIVRANSVATGASRVEKLEDELQQTTKRIALLELDLNREKEKNMRLQEDLTECRALVAEKDRSAVERDEELETA